MRVNLEKYWYQSSLTWLTFLLLPLSWLFRFVVSLRRFFYRIKIIKSYRFPVPVIVVGNITVGGTGKTPFVIWLANLLRAQGYTPGIVSRGVGGEAHLEPFWVNAYSGVREVGDEAILLAKRANCPVVVCIDRVAAVRELLANAKCNVVITDDGLQHYRLARNVEIALIDGMRECGNKQLLPAGPLREPVSRLKVVDVIVRQGQSMILQGDFLVALNDETKRIPFNEFKNKRVHAVAAIGNPLRFFNMLREKGLDVIEHVFPDHSFFVLDDFKFADDLPIVMTEKDMVKCGAFADDRMWYVPVDAAIDTEVEAKIFRCLQK